jgi:2-polyprenyl-6-methoxyphenol hydroxylase-like FAD-dependent oxidoreductase
MGKPYDVIVVGARCAGSPTAMLLARKGYRVLLVDKATFPSDTVSTHLVQPPGVARLAEWGLLERLAATGCPPIHTFGYDFGPVRIEGSPGTAEAPLAYCPRRTVLDKLLVDAASEAGAEVREGCKVEEPVWDARVVGIRGRASGGAPFEERAAVVVGADGRHSRVAEAVAAPAYNERPALLSARYAYFSGLPMEGRFHTFASPWRGGATAPTHDGLTLVIAGWPVAEDPEKRRDLDAAFHDAFLEFPEFAARLREARRETPLAGTAVPNYFRKPYGPGWALAGDAGYNRDFITAQGIADAFRDADLLSAALDEALGGRRSFEAALGDYQRLRDAQVAGMYEMTCELATLAPPPPPMQSLLAAMVGDRPAMDAFARMNAGTITPDAFMSDPAIAALMPAEPEPA